MTSNSPQAGRSEMENLLITGGSGFVGQNLAEYFIPRRPTVLTYLSRPITGPAKSFQLDITDSDAVRSLFEKVRPGTVVHTAGNKDTRFCEAHPAEAHRINAQGTQNISRACREWNATLVYLSTDLVFSGEEGNYQENDLPQPRLEYGKSKLLGELLAREEAKNVAVCRSGGIFGKRSPLLKWLTDELTARRSVPCFVDVFNSPTYVENLAEMIEAIVERKLFGLFHTVGRERVSRLDFFRSYARIFDLDVNLLSPVSVSTMKEKLFLQPDSSLSSEQSAAKIGMVFNSVAEGFERLRTAGGI